MKNETDPFDLVALDLMRQRWAAGRKERGLPEAPLWGGEFVLDDGEHSLEAAELMELVDAAVYRGMRLTLLHGDNIGLWPPSAQLQLAEAVSAIEALRGRVNRARRSPLVCECR